MPLVVYTTRIAIFKMAEHLAHTDSEAGSIAEDEIGYGQAGPVIDKIIYFAARYLSHDKLLVFRRRVGAGATVTGVPEVAKQIATNKPPNPEFWDP